VRPHQPIRRWGVQEDVGIARADCYLIAEAAAQFRDKRLPVGLHLGVDSGGSGDLLRTGRVPSGVHLVVVGQLARQVNERNADAPVVAHRRTIATLRTGTPSRTVTRSAPTRTVTVTAPPSPPPGQPASPPSSAVAAGGAAGGSCHPLSNEGTCYEPGEFCRNSDHGVTGVAGDGKTIICEDNDGWRWEPV